MDENALANTEYITALIRIPHLQPRYRWWNNNECNIWIGFALFYLLVCCQMKSISKFTLQIECTSNSCETNHFGEHLNKWQNYVCIVQRIQNVDSAACSIENRGETRFLRSFASLILLVFIQSWIVELQKKTRNSETLEVFIACSMKNCEITLQWHCIHRMPFFNTLLFTYRSKSSLPIFKYMFALFSQYSSV